MELQTAFEAIYTKLSTDATIIADTGPRIYEEVAPLDAAYPFILVSLSNGNDVSGANLARCHVQCEALIYVVGTGDDMVRLLRVADKIDTLLHNQTLTTLLSITRVRSYRSSGWESGILYKNLGGFYAVEIGA